MRVSRRPSVKARWLLVRPCGIWKLAPETRSSGGATFPGLATAPVSDEGLPAVSEVLAEYRARARDRDRRRPEGLLGPLSDLHETNLTQWSFEDRARRADGDDATIANAKREIDELNARRHHLVEAIDAAIDESVPQAASATPSTESPGMVFDRLSVLVIRIHQTELATAADRPDATQYETRLPVLHEQLATLEEALNALLAEIRGGTRRFVPYQSLKLYGR
jgi:hypothetical protein